MQISTFLVKKIYLNPLLRRSIHNDSEVDSDWLQSAAEDQLKMQFNASNIWILIQRGSNCHPKIVGDLFIRFQLYHIQEHTPVYGV